MHDADSTRQPHRPSDLRTRTRQFATAVVRCFVSLPRNDEARILGRQLLRSGTSVGAHYREASRARSNAEFISKLEVGLQELDESAYWMELLVDSNLAATASLQPLIQETHELLAIFTSIVKSRKSNPPRP
jgi:four helix bundle protein